MCISRQLDPADGLASHKRRRSVQKIRPGSCPAQAAFRWSYLVAMFVPACGTSYDRFTLIPTPCPPPSPHRMTADKRSIWRKMSLISALDILMKSCRFCS